MAIQRVRLLVFLISFQMPPSLVRLGGHAFSRGRMGEVSPTLPEWQSVGRIKSPGSVFLHLNQLWRALSLRGPNTTRMRSPQPSRPSGRSLIR